MGNTICVNFNVEPLRKHMQRLLINYGFSQTKYLSQEKKMQSSVPSRSVPNH
jgi:hypothetical protein